MAGFGKAFSNSFENAERARASKEQDAFRVAYDSYVQKQAAYDAEKKTWDKSMTKAEQLAQQYNQPPEAVGEIAKWFAAGWSDEAVEKKVAMAKFAAPKAIVPDQASDANNIDPMAAQMGDTGLDPSAAPMDASANNNPVAAPVQANQNPDLLGSLTGPDGLFKNMGKSDAEQAQGSVMESVGIDQAQFDQDNQGFTPPESPAMDVTFSPATEPVTPQNLIKELGLENGVNAGKLGSAKAIIGQLKESKEPADIKKVAMFEAMLPECFSKEDFVYLNTASEFVYCFCNIVGPLVAGAIIIILGSKLSLAIIGILYFISSIILILSKPKKENFVFKKFEELGHLLCEHFDLIKEGFIYIFRPECPIQLGLMMSILSNILLGAQETLTMFIARKNFNVDAESLAFGISSASITTLVILFFAIKWLNKYHIFLIMIFSIILDALANIGVGLSPNVLLLFTFYCISTISTAIYNVFWKTLRQSYIPPEMLGRVISVCRSLTYGFLGLGALLGGFLINYMSPRSILILGGTLVTLFGILAFYLKKLYPADTFRKNI